MSKILSLIGTIFIIFTVVSFWGVNKVEAAPGGCIASSSGLWSDPNTWTLSCLGAGGIPDSTHGAVINSGAVITVDMAAEAGSLQINNSGATTGIVISGTNSLTVLGGINLSAPTADGTTSIDVGAGTLTTNPGTISVVGGTDSKISEITVNTGTINIPGISFSGTAANARLTSTGASTINVSGSIFTGGKLTTSGTGLINFNGSSLQVMGDYDTYNNIEINNTSGGVSLQGNVTINGTLVVSSGVLDTGVFNLTVEGTTTVENGATIQFAGPSTQTFTGDVTLNSGSTWIETSAPAINFGGNLTDNSTTFTADTGIHTFSGTGKTYYSNDQELPYINVTGTLTNNGIVTVTDLSGSGTFINSASGTLKTVETITITNLDVSAVGNIVSYKKGGNQTVKDADYSVLLLKGSGIKTINSGLDILYLSINSGVSADLTGSSRTNTLILDGTGQVNFGTYGSTASGATNQDDIYFSNTGTVLVGVPYVYEPTVISAGTVGASSSPTVVGAFAVVSGLYPETIDQFTIENKTGLTADSTDITSVAIYSDDGVLGVIDGGDAVACTEATTNLTTDFIVGGSVINFTCSSPISISASTAQNYLVVVTTTPDAAYGKTIASKVNAHFTNVNSWAAADLETTNSITITDTQAPDTMIVSGPNSSTTNTTATFEFSATEPASTFECSLDASPYVACVSPYTTIALGVGAHTFLVKASDVLNNTDSSPATQTWTITSSNSNNGSTTVLIPSIPTSSFSNPVSTQSSGSANISIPGCIGNNIFSITTGQKCHSQTVDKSYQFTRVLKLGSYGDDVQKLQEFLNSHGAIITTTGNGSPGHEIKVFGSRTTKALALYQKSNGITPALGYFGVKTMKFVNDILKAGN